MTEPFHEDQPGAPAAPWPQRLAPAGIATGVVAAAALALLSGPRPGVARAEAVLGVLALGVLARMGGGLGGAGTADLMLRASAVVGPDGMRERVAAAGRRLTAQAAGAAVASGVAAVWLATSGGAADRVVAASVGACLLIRSRLFAGPAGRLLAASGAIAAVVAAVRLAAAPPAAAGWLVATTGAGLAGLALLAAGAGGHAPGGGGRLLLWAEPTAVTSMMCTLTLAAALPDAVAR
jgi:hypothetical protein